MSEDQKPEVKEPTSKQALSKEILIRQHAEAVRQLNIKLDETEQMKGIVNYIAGLLKEYELPSIPEKEKLPDEKK
jgi:hypothetical protein